jgi:hypothetical protein
VTGPRDTTRDELADMIGQWISDIPARPDFLDAADAILARYHVTPKINGDIDQRIIISGTGWHHVWPGVQVRHVDNFDD